MAWRSRRQDGAWNNRRADSRRRDADDWRQDRGSRSRSQQYSGRRGDWDYGQRYDEARPSGRERYTARDESSNQRWSREWRAEDSRERPARGRNDYYDESFRQDERRRHHWREDPDKSDRAVYARDSPPAPNSRRQSPRERPPAPPKSRRQHVRESAASANSLRQYRPAMSRNPPRHRSRSPAARSPVARSPVARSPVARSPVGRSPPAGRPPAPDTRDGGLRLAPATRRVRRRRVAPGAADPGKADPGRDKGESHYNQSREQWPLDRTPSPKRRSRPLAEESTLARRGRRMAPAAEEVKSDVGGAAPQRRKRQLRKKVSAPPQEETEGWVDDGYRRDRRDSSAIATDVERKTGDIPPLQVDDDPVPSFAHQQDEPIVTDHGYSGYARTQEVPPQGTPQQYQSQGPPGFIGQVEPDLDDSYSYSYSDSEYSDDGYPLPYAGQFPIPGMWQQPMSNYWSGVDPYAAQQGKGGHERLHRPVPPPSSLAQELELAPGLFDRPPPGVAPDARDPYAAPRNRAPPPPPHGYSHMGYMQMYSMGPHGGQPPSTYSHMPPQGYNYGQGPESSSAPTHDQQRKGKGKKGRDGKGEGKGAKGSKGARKGKGKDAAKESRKSGPPEHLQKLFYKTRLCPHFDEGKCRHGADCTYAHSEAELRKAPNVAKTALCQDFEQHGSCRRGDQCDFAHGWSEVRAYKTTMCKAHTQSPGSCKKGDHCRFAHGEHELRDRPEDLPSEVLIASQQAEEANP